jgi:hypothetical protein
MYALSVTVVRQMVLQVALTDIGQMMQIGRTADTERKDFPIFEGRFVQVADA